MNRILNYDKKFYVSQRNDNLSSAETIVPIVIRMLKKKHVGEISVIDLGCGTGNWLSIFKKNICVCVGGY